MRRFLCALLIGFAALATSPLLAADTDALGWIARIYSAGQKLSYSGVIVYQAGVRSETSRIVHLFENGHELEKLETLDGSPREVIRTRDLVKCFLPKQQTLIIDQPGGSRGFPARLLASHATLSEFYRLRMGERGRVAGLETQQVLLEPKDDLRFGHVLWADAASGLLLKARMLDHAGGVVEQFSFTEVRIGEQIDRREFVSRFEDVPGWRVINARGTELSEEGLGWRLTAAVPGFRLVSAVRRSLGEVHGEVVHLIYSDGIAAMSVFIEPLAEGREPALGASSSGPVNIYTRVVGAHLVTSLGEAPPRAVQVLGEAVTRGRP